MKRKGVWLLGLVLGTLVAVGAMVVSARDAEEGVLQCGPIEAVYSLPENSTIVIAGTDYTTPSLANFDRIAPPRCALIRLMVNTCTNQIVGIAHSDGSQANNFNNIVTCVSPSPVIVSFPTP